MDGSPGPAGETRAGSPAGAGAEGWAGRGRWAGPETAALGLTLALAWRAAAGEPCVGTSRGCLPASRRLEPQAAWLTWARLSATRRRGGRRVAGTSLGPASLGDRALLTLTRPLLCHLTTPY